MKITLKTKVTKHQMGGQIASEDQAVGASSTGAETTNPSSPEEGMEQDPLLVLGDTAAQALQTQDCQMAMQVCQAVIEIIQQVQGSAPQEPQGEPVFKKGGILIRRIKK